MKYSRKESEKKMSKDQSNRKENPSEKDSGDNDRRKFDKEEITKIGSSSSPDKFEVFEQWLKTSGTRMPKLELRDYGDEVRGCHAIQDIQDDEIIIQVPLSCLITVEMGKETEIGRVILASNVELDAPKHIFLMIFMLVDRKNPKSFFKPYYDILPATLSNMPIFWTKEELAFLQGSYLLEQISERNAAIEADYESICNIYPAFHTSIATLQEFKWARMCVCSRNFGLVVNGVQTAALVPYADMLNHYRPRETKWQFDDSLQGFTVVSLQGIASTAQVYDSYGRKCNHRFLLNYGFSIENNVEADGYCPNEVPFFVELKQSDPLYESKCSFWRRDFSIPYRRIRCSMSDNENMKVLMAFLRIIEADKEDFDLLVTCSGSNIYRSIRDAQVSVSVRNELKVLSTLADMCDSYLDKYPSTFEEDCKALASDSLPPFSNEKHALIQVRGEKEVLRFYKDFAVTAISLLQTTDLHQFDSLLEQVKVTKHSVFYQYCQSTINRLQQDEIRRAEIRGRNYDLSRPTVV
jgi:histone-lysine N-methyltransferase SETD3